MSSPLMYRGLRVLVVIGAILMLQRICSRLVIVPQDSIHSESANDYGCPTATDSHEVTINPPIEVSIELRNPTSLTSGPLTSLNPEMALALTPIRTPSKTIVAAALKQDNTSWIQEFFPDWQHSIYVMDDPMAHLTVARNKGNEGSAYLSYLITHYYGLPDHIVFIHGPRYQWHNEEMMYDHVPVLDNLRLSHVDEMGYASLRCTWDPGCPVSLRPDHDKEDGLFGYEAAYAQAWSKFWPEQPVPEKVGAPCCAQFAVSKAQVLKRPVQEYEKVRQWLWETPMEGTKSGRVMEYMWHILFGQEVVACPDAGECFCQKFGLCDLDCRSERSCENRFWQPWPLTELPSNWPFEGQGMQGWPVRGWWQESIKPSQGSL